MSVPAETPLNTASGLIAAVLEEQNEGSKLTSSSVARLKLAHRFLAGLEGYLEASSSPAPAVQRPLLAATAAHDWAAAHQQGLTMHKLGAHWSAGAYEGAFVGMLTRLLSAQHALEIGMFTGTTTVCIAHNLPPEGSVTTLEIDPYLEKFTQPLFHQSGLQDRINVRIGDANQSLKKLAEEKRQYDIIFIDADKPGYVGYFEAIMEGELLRKGGLMVVDNTLYKGSAAVPELAAEIQGISADNSEAIVKFNSVVSRDLRVETILLPLRDGVTFIMRKE